MSRVLAETVSFTEEEILVIMLVLLGMLAAAVAIVALGCFWAWRAGRGSQRALGGWLAMGALELLLVLGSLPEAIGGNPNLFFVGPLATLVLQALLFVAARRGSRS